MLARTFSRRARLASATIIAALAGAALLPATANAATPGQAATATPAKPLTITLGTPSHSDRPLVRGGATETFTVTVSNSAKHAVTYVPAVWGSFAGPSPIAASDIKFAVQPIHAPSTGFSAGEQDQGVLASFFPAGGRVGKGFSVPAAGSFSWKVTVGLAKSYPANDATLALGFNSLDNDVSNFARQVFRTSPTFKSGQFTEKFVSKYTNGGGTVSATKPLDVALTMHNGSGAAFSSGLQTWITILADSKSGQTQPLAVDVLENGHWVTLKSQGGQWTLPRIAPGLANGATYTYQLRLRGLKYQGTAKWTNVDLNAQTALTSGNTYVFGAADKVVTVLR
ncbi:hypothetical protein [Kitasatospora sp. MAP5-34]|uniref:hypothetical protein n=1 Tax=Kitasatospora sp. MAP5-34 TaxID=3035102 RepID=UPI00247622A3|nr:hypothetical protein [Kitasatospora sp. MAP5-34]MDH6577537.1 hypothetical protein [Kitasatospora sp. MAP5-34]